MSRGERWIVFRGGGLSFVHMKNSFMFTYGTLAASPFPPFPVCLRSPQVFDANPSSEDDAVLATVTGVFERVFRVRASGAVQGVQPTDGNPIVR